MKATQYLSSLKYLAIKGESRFSACRDAYKSIHAVSNKTVIRLAGRFSLYEIFY